MELQLPMTPPVQWSQEICLAMGTIKFGILLNVDE